MQKIPDKTYERLLSLSSQLGKIPQKAEQLVRDLNAKLAKLEEEANDLREEALDLLEDVCDSTSEYYDSRPESWMNSDEGAAYQAWMIDIRHAINSFEDEVSFEIPLHCVDNLLDMTDAIAGMPSSPGDEG